MKVKMPTVWDVYWAAVLGFCFVLIADITNRHLYHK